MFNFRRTSLIPIDSSSLTNEKSIAFIKVVLSSIALAAALLYTVNGTKQIQHSIILTSIFLFLWQSFNLAIWIFFKKTGHIKLVAVASAAVDIIVVLSIDIILKINMPFHSINSPVISLYIMVIILSAIRSDHRFVIITGIILAILNFLISVPHYFLHNSLSEINFHSADNELFKWSLLYQITMSGMIGFFAVLIGYITKELVKSERHYLDLFENIPDGIIIIDQDLSIISANRKFSRMAKISVDILKNAHLSFVLSGLKDNSLKKITDFNLLFDDMITHLKTAEKEKIPVKVTSIPFEFNGKQCRELSVRDISSQLELENQMEASQKVQTVAKLAGGLAHDFNNLLNGIFGATSLATLSINRFGTEDDKKRYSQHFETIAGCADQAAKLLFRLSDYSKSSNAEKSNVDLNRIISDTILIARNSSPDNVVIKNLFNIPIKIKVDKLSISQAILNLLINAKDAIGSKAGEIIIDVYPADVDTVKHIKELNSEKQYICIEVKDNGPGMTMDIQEKIFEPFFTTKLEGKGTGIGLSVVYNIAVSHGGVITFTSVPSKGTTFYMYLLT
ncbi:MAG: PAS domain-containing protein [Deltaproteobacteria bacterium]|nr:PAS domain-containing protein [Deltaproteobacteria bacterium]